ncbi:related to C6 finger domain protein [Phialocephala subalpina]|uniref:Related to C6 finger domain protein n=1 Tax=Phialocephala subalpina TaxID=576137 RepID=A0A1L7XCH8_9HELO|nr:related to C6 finger domain protein [Phialocephala subalpina]
MKVPGSDGQKHARKPHRKSRLGCGTCKKRRIKCDEGKPSCSNCEKHELRCDFLPAIDSDSAADGTAHSNVARPAKAGRKFIPSKYESAPSQVSASSDGQETSPNDNTPISVALSPDDLELWHHFIMTTSLTFAEDPGSLNFWQSNLPKMGFQYHFILHFLLTLSALHLARLRPEKKDQYLAQAEHHHTIALRGATPDLANLNDSNCQAIYAASILICFCTLARGPHEGEYLGFSKHGDSQYLVSFRGVKAIIESHQETLHSTILSPIIESITAHNHQRGIWKRDVIPEYKIPMEKLRAFISIGSFLTDVTTLNAYLRAFDTLLQAFAGVYEGMIDASDETSLSSHIVFAWMYRMSDEFAQGLREKHPLALALFAHYMVLLKELEYGWAMEGWAHHVLGGIYGFLDEEHRLWIEWPMKETGYITG